MNNRLTCDLSEQYVTEKIGATEGTKLTDDYLEMEKVGFLKRLSLRADD